MLRERRVPESPLGRALGFAGMVASLLLGTGLYSVSRTWSGPPKGAVGSGGGGVYNSVITGANAQRLQLANALCRMRGAALKIDRGQLLSIQDEYLISPQVCSCHVNCSSLFFRTELQLAEDVILPLWRWDLCNVAVATSLLLVLLD